MNSLKEVQKRMEKERIKFCNLRLSPETWVNGNEFFDMENFIEFVHSQKINIVFGCEIFDDADDYLITEEVVEEELGKYSAEEMRNIIENDIREYNEKVWEIDFNIPSLYIVACLYEGQYFFIKKSVDRGIDESFIMEPNEKLQEIVLNNERNIKIQRQEKNTQ